MCGEHGLASYAAAAVAEPPPSCAALACSCERPAPRSASGATGNGCGTLAAVRVCAAPLMETAAAADAAAAPCHGRLNASALHLQA
jgi:hypothetical protein